MIRRKEMKKKIVGLNRMLVIAMYLDVSKKRNNQETLAEKNLFDKVVVMIMQVNNVVKKTKGAYIERGKIVN